MTFFKHDPDPNIDPMADRSLIQFHCYRDDLDEVFQWVFQVLDKYNLILPDIEIAPLQIPEDNEQGYAVKYHCHVVAQFDHVLTTMQANPPALNPGDIK